jgi:hypothetical protein
MKSTFVGKYFIIREFYEGGWPEGYPGEVVASVGKDSYLIRGCGSKSKFIQRVVPAAFFIESEALIFDTFAEMKESHDRQYPKKAI